MAAHGENSMALDSATVAARMLGDTASAMASVMSQVGRLTVSRPTDTSSAPQAR
jgi:hypothetical protein